MNEPTALLILLILAGYVASIYLHPNSPCRKCEGSGRHFGGVFTYASRSCERCNGSGKKRRIGSVLLGVADREGSVLAGRAGRRKR